MDVFGGRAPELMSERELVHALDQVTADIACLETSRLRILAALDKTGYAEEVGARDTVQFIERRYRLDHSRARRDVRLARALPRYSAVLAALPDVTAPADDTREAPGSTLQPAQAEAIVCALEKVPTTVPVADLEVAERELVRLAKHLPPTELRKAAEQARDILDTDGPEPEEHKAYARESLTLTTADRGVKFKGYLANENAELLRSLIVAGARPHRTIDGAPDPRPREKRQADALTTTLALAATALDAGTPSPTIPRPTTHSATNTSTSTATNNATNNATGTTMGPATGTATGTANGTVTESAAESAADKAAASAMAGAARDAAGGAADTSAESVDLADGAVVCGTSGAVVSGLGGDVVPGFGAKANITVTIDLQDLKAATADAIGYTVYSSGLSAATIRRLACDANVIPIVLGSNSEPLDVGRRERLVTRAMRRALNTRDKGCVVCGAPPIICDAHHLISWIDGGDTKISNLVLVCRRHHTDLHAGHWTITITNGEVHVARPTWTDPIPLSTPTPTPPNTACPPPTPPSKTPTRPDTPSGASKASTRPSETHARPDTPHRASPRPTPWSEAPGRPDMPRPRPAPPAPQSEAPTRRDMPRGASSAPIRRSEAPGHPDTPGPRPVPPVAAPPPSEAPARLGMPRAGTVPPATTSLGGPAGTSPARSVLERRALQRLRESTGRDDFTDAERRTAIALECWGEGPEPSTNTMRVVPDNPVDTAPEHNPVDTARELRNRS